MLLEQPSLIRVRTLLAPYRMPMPKVLGGPREVGVSLWARYPCTCATLAGQLQSQRPLSVLELTDYSTRYKSTSRIKKRNPLGPHCRPMPRAFG